MSNQYSCSSTPVVILRCNGVYTAKVLYSLAPQLGMLYSRDARIPEFGPEKSGRCTPMPMIDSTDNLSSVDCTRCSLRMIPANPAAQQSSSGAGDRIDLDSMVSYPQFGDWSD